MTVERKKINRTKRRAQRTHNSIRKHSDLPRVSVFRSLNHIYAQLIDDSTQKTVASCSSFALKDTVSGDKTAIARAIGLELAARAKTAGVEAVVFDRGRYLYHGRVKALADGLREGGLKI